MLKRLSSFTIILFILIIIPMEVFAESGMIEGVVIDKNTIGDTNTNAGT